MSVKPITPGKVRKRVPEIIIEAFNALIEESWDGSSSKVTQKDATKRIKQLMGGDGGFPTDWLDVEPIYRKAGWKVEYHKAAYCETPFPPYFVFKK